MQFSKYCVDFKLFDLSAQILLTFGDVRKDKKSCDINFS